jgi:hypothetical protein
MENELKSARLLAGVLITLALISNKVEADANFKSRPTTVKTFENDSVLLPCYLATGKNKLLKEYEEKYFLKSAQKKFMMKKNSSSMTKKEFNHEKLYPSAL